MYRVKTLIGASRIWVATISCIVVASVLGGLPSLASAGASPTCSNEGIRAAQGTTRLPECRAYEEVTPHYKQAFPLYPKSIAPDGEKAVLYSLANLGAPGAGESPLEGDLYIASRAEGGWQLSPLNAPLSEFVGQVPQAYEAASGETLWEQHQPSQPVFTRDLYARSLDGDHRLIGQISVPFEGEGTQEGTYMYLIANHVDVPFAATHDFNHVIVQALSAEDYLPFDETKNHTSYYEYSGIDNPPVIVGVEGEKGSRHLVSLCGTDLGSGETASGALGSTLNALSADGETVFFTAEPEGVCGLRGPKVAEVFSRLHGSALSPLPAETVDVSESECTVLCGGESSKNFEGASEDGKIVFFTSTQKLTNDATDGTVSGEAYGGGGCAETKEGAGGCNLYAYDFGNPSVACQKSHHCLRLVAGGEVLGVAGIAEDGQRIYYVKRDAGSPDLYVYDMASEESTLVAHLSNEDSEMWQKEFRKPVEVTGEDGRFLLFASSTPGLTPDQTSSLEQLFEYDAVTGELVRVTKGENGYNEDGNGVEAGVPANSLAEVTEKLGDNIDYKAEANRLNVSEDGSTVVFRTRGKLSPFALSAGRCSSVYVFHTGGLLSAGEVHLLSDGVDTHQIGPLCGALVYPAMMDASGDNVFFSSGDSLVAGDVDGGQRDLFDARVGGGFVPSVGAGCFGEGCVSPVPSTAPVVGPGGSAVLAPEAGGVKSVVSVGGSSSSGGGKAKGGARRKVKRGRSRGGLERALRACRGKPRARRVVCERAARRKGGS